MSRIVKSVLLSRFREKHVCNTAHLLIVLLIYFHTDYSTLFGLRYIRPYFLCRVEKLQYLALYSC